MRPLGKGTSPSVPLQIEGGRKQRRKTSPSVTLQIEREDAEMEAKGENLTLGPSPNREGGRGDGSGEHSLSFEER